MPRTYRDRLLLQAVKLGTVTYKQQENAGEYLTEKDKVEKIVKDAALSTHSFSDAQIYSPWITNETIGHELFRNLGLAMLCVVVISVVMLADFKLCAMVLTCVVLTVVDVTGMAHFWGQSIDTVSAVCVVLVVGFCVDYSAHIAHAFIVSEGKKKNGKPKTICNSILFFT